MSEILASLSVHFDKYQHLAGPLALFSLLLLLFAAIALPLVLLMLPQDYFHAPGRRGALHRTGRLIRWPMLVIKNLLGFVLLLLGILLLFLPGQGLLTILTALFLMDYPGKYRLERKLVANRRILATINLWRRKFNRPPLDPGF